MIRWVDCRREPFRLLFPLGVLFGCVGVSHWLWYAVGWADASRMYHASMQLGVYMVCFIVGFLWTAMPRMTATAPATSTELGLLLALLAAQPLFLALHAAFAAHACFAATMILFVWFAVRRIARRRSIGGSPPPIELIWVPIGVLFGVMGAAVNRPMAQQGFVLAVVLGVGGFMGPRLMGRGFEWSQGKAASADAMRGIRAWRLRWHLMAAAGLAISFALEATGHLRAAYGLRAGIVSAEFFWTVQLHRPPVVSDGYVKLLWVSFWMIVTGFWAVMIWPRYRVTMLHLVLIGGFSLMTFAVGTMVVLSHAGQSERLRRPLWILSVVAIGMMGATATRMLADFWPTAYFPLLAIASGCWLLAGFAWLIFALPHVLTPVSEERIAQQHEAAQHRLRQSACAKMA